MTTDLPQNTKCNDYFHDWTDRTWPGFLPQGVTMRTISAIQVLPLGLSLLLLASFQSNNALSPSFSKNSTAVKAESVATSDKDGATSGSPSKRESSGSRPARTTPVKTSSPVTSSPPIKTSPLANTSSAAAAPLVKDFPLVKTPSPKESGRTKVCEKCTPDPRSKNGTKCITCRQCSDSQKPKPGGRRLSRFMLRSLQQSDDDLNCERCDRDDNACQGI